MPPMEDLVSTLFQENEPDWRESTETMFFLPAGPLFIHCEDIKLRRYDAHLNLFVKVSRNDLDEMFESELEKFGLLIPPWIETISKGSAAVDIISLYRGSSFKRHDWLKIAKSEFLLAKPSDEALL